MNIAEKILRAKADYDAVFEAGKKAVGEVLKFSDVASTAYRSIVPNGVEPFAKVNKIGGMTYKSRQLIPFPYYYQGEKVLNSVTWNFTENGITASGTQNKSNALVLYDFSTPITLNGTYTASTNKALPSSCVLYLVFDDDLGHVEFFASGKIVETKTINNRKCTSIRLWLGTGSTFNGENYLFMLNEGTSALPFEPYFEGLRSASVSELKSEGANLFNYDNVFTDIKVGNNVIDIDRVSYYVDLFTNTVGSGTTFPIEQRDKLLYLSEGAIYAYYDMESEAKDKELCLFKVDITTGQTKQTFQLKNGEVRYVTEETKGYYTVRKYNNQPSKISNLVISRTPQTKYIPYMSDTLAIPEAVKSLAGYGLGVNAEYYNYIDFERKVFVQNVYRKVFDGTEHIVVSLRPAGHYRYAIRVVPYKAPDVAGDIIVICNHYPSTSTYRTNDRFEDGISASNENLFLVDTAVQVDNVDDIKAKLKAWYDEGNPLIVDYILETPIETDISAYLTDEYIEVEGGGTVTAVNEYGYDVPTNISYLTDTQGG